MAASGEGVLKNNFFFLLSRLWGVESVFVSVSLPAVWILLIFVADPDRRRPIG